MMTSDTWSGLIPVFASKALMTCAPKSEAGILARVPPNLPTAVLSAATMTTSSMFMLSCCGWQSGLKVTPSIRLGHDVTSRGRLDAPVLAVSQCTARGDLAPRVPFDPGAPLRPPASRHVARRRQPALRIRPGGTIDPVVALVLRRGIDHAGDMAARAQHESRVAREQLRRRISRFPWNDVVFARCVQECRYVD